MASKDDLLFAQTALKKSLVTKEQARQCLDAAAKAAVKGVPVSIAQVFIDRGILTSDQVNDILEAMGRSGSREKLNVVGDFRIIGKLGEGGMGIVYRARQLSLDREVALKILPPRLAADEAFVERFHREARAAARLNHPNIIQVYAAGVEKGYHYMAMELVEGATTLELLERKGKFPEKVALRVLLEIASALDQAHRHGIVHRDIKPDNIMMTKDGVSKLADLGLAKETVSAAVTQSGAIVGTPRYMSPEQARSEDQVDGRADIYSLGSSVYYLVAGSPTFDGQNAMEVILKHINEEPRPLKSLAPHLSDGFCAIIGKMLQKNPDHRYQSAKDLVTDLERLASGQFVPSPAGLAGTVPSDHGLGSVPSPASPGTPAGAQQGSRQGSGIDLSSESLKFAEQTPLPAVPPGVSSPGAGPLLSSAGAPLPPLPLQTTATRHGQPTPSSTPILVSSGSLWFLLKTVVFLAVVAGIGYYAWLHRGRFIPPEATKEKDVDPEVPKAFKALFYDIKENPDRHLTNLAKLKAFDPKPLDEDSRIQFDHKIREIEERIEVEGAKLLESISGRVKEELRKKDFPAAMAAAEAFPAQLSSPKWREKTEELRVRVRRETSEELKAQLSALNEKVANGELEEVIKQGETLGLDRLQDLSPEETAQLKAVLQSAADTLSRRRKAQEVVRDTSMQLCRILADDRVFDAFDFAAKTLADPDWVRTVSDDSKGHILRQELEALRDLYANAVKFLEQQVGKEFEFRSRPAVIQSFKDGTIDLDLKGVRQYRERPISEVFTVSDIARLAEMSWDENEDEFLRKVAILYLLTDDVKEAERNFKKLPEEMSAPYREELKFHQFVQQLEEAMAFIPATKFPMGISQTVVDKTIESIRSTPEGELTNADWLRSEIPRREIELDAFFIDKYEVSNERYAGFLEFMQRTNDHSKCHPRETKDKDHTPKAWYDKNIGQSQRSLPVVGVDWFDAYAFAAWSGVRLPTEAEWECAASWNPKTGKKVEYPWLLKASKYHPRYARFARLEQGKLVVDTEDGYEHAKPVTSCPFGASPNGCRNMAGNVWEWIFDWHAPQYQLEGPLKNPKGAETGTARVVRGGSYMTVYYLGRTTARAPSDPLRREFDIGFRCAADPPSLLPVRLKRYGVMP